MVIYQFKTSKFKITKTVLSHSSCGYSGRFSNNVVIKEVKINDCKPN